MADTDKIIATLKGIPTRDELYSLLKNEIVEVTFTKLNGDIRKMPCTLIESFLPPAKKMMQLHRKKFARYQIK